MIGYKIYRKNVDGEEYIALHNSIFIGRGRKTKAKEYAKFMRAEGKKVRILHEDDKNKSVVWFTSKK